VPILIRLFEEYTDMPSLIEVLEEIDNKIKLLLYSIEGPVLI